MAGRSDQNTVYQTLSQPNRLRSVLKRFLQDQSGATSIEYALIGVSISIVIILAVNGIGQSMQSIYTALSTALSSS